MKQRIRTDGRMTIDVDLGDETSEYCVLDEEGTVVEEGRLATSLAAFRRRFGSLRPARIAMEVGTHSPWASRLLKKAGHEVWAANARKLRLIFENRRKSDRLDARQLARVARMDPSLLASIEHRTEEVAPHTGRGYDCCRDLSSLVDLDAEPTGTTPRSDRAPPSPA